MTNIEIRNHPKFKNVYISGSQEYLKLYTKNLDVGKRIYGEKLIIHKDIQYREWDPFRSKLAALILENPITNFLTDNLKCLYLGASSGTTISHLSDIIQSGIIYGVEFSERSIRQLIQNTSKRVNIVPILADARFPESYAKYFFTDIDLIYQDVAQPRQANIAVENCNYYLKNDGILIIAIKSQSIDSIQKSEYIYAQEKKILEKAGYQILESINIHKYAANHIILIAKKAIS
ncbi:MAG: fibrillarin-like rRNA/tRNA 2'-O-methyltransferase [Promethearchaeota archaeon]|nr:MAG: fibrillarin-like rRNA/tRNA 2'-O-methyltransferase [Candidatus Lokiarchaeota archaeon]